MTASRQAARSRDRRSAAASAPAAEPVRPNGFAPDPDWYQDAVIYEVHVRAFHDSDGDGIGDFRGLTERLDYLQDLGVTAIWILPFYPSPLKDDGYDIADYTGVNADYGNLRDVRTFIREAHRRGLRVITELVCNHTSDEHPWFQRARRAAPGSSARDFYVWSETPDRYPDARIIFKDFESSNWSWDPVAGAYFWHRFYGHQPDLNFDNPKVGEAILKAMEFWLDLGVDGLRLDAVPYLFERDGTNGENLPETHAFLKALRGHIDERYADRMLLAEANQWPEDAVAYFGDGDECHMAFHFPVMPRMFMALRMEDRFPIVDIMEQTPAIPASAQWALFLRNHDELTLEMVTDEERDYMYRVYAGDPQARINLGIRRRLAPLLGNNRRRVELLNGLLFSLPGTPVIYYGDEIGMGDNVYLGDRDGVRTPMQWSGDRNAGFSVGNRQRLYLPVVTDPEYHYEAVNVAAQQANPHSLLWWMKRIIALRKRHPAFGRGSIEFLHPENRKVLAFVRATEDETLLVVANLSRYSQWTHLDLARWEGLLPIELFGSVEFPRIGREPWMVSLGPHSFLWFRIESDVVSTAITEAHAAELPSIPRTPDLAGLLGRHRRDRLTEVLLDWMQHRRWYRGKARRIKSASIVEGIPVPVGRRDGLLVLVSVAFSEGEEETYSLPLIALSIDEAAGLLADTPQAEIARLTAEGEPAQVLVDGAMVPEFAEALLGVIGGRRRLKGGSGELAGQPSRAYRSLRGPSEHRLTAVPLGAEQSNSSTAFDERIVLKLFRAIEPGVNPELEVGRFLDEHGFPHVPKVAGAIEYRKGKTEPSTVAIAQGYVANASDLWAMTKDEAAAFLELVGAETTEPPEPTPGTAALVREAGDLPEIAHRLCGTHLETARLLGTRTGELHRTLAGHADDPAFAPEPLTSFHLRSLFQAIRGQTAESFRLLKRHRDRLDPELQERVDQVLAAGPQVEEHLRPLLERRIGGMRIRIHGDYHLGQVIHTGKDVVVIDFEGEPARSIGERRLKRPALTDVAGMLRSYDYAAFGALHDERATGAVDGDVTTLDRWARAWYDWSARAFLDGYRRATAGAAFLPGDDEAFVALLDALLLSKAAYELRYELNSRPEWIGIPLAGIEELLAG